MPIHPIILLADMALAAAANSEERILAYDLAASAIEGITPRSTAEAALCMERIIAARGAADALRAADSKQLQFRELLRVLQPSPSADPRQADGITQDSDGPEYDIPPGLFEVLRRDHEEYSAGRAELGMRSLSLRQFIAAMTDGPLIRTREAIASAIAIAEQEAGLLSQAVS